MCCEYNSYLKLLGSVGKYILKYKGKAHPDSIKLLHSLYAQFETVVSSPEMTEAQIKSSLAGQIRQFKQLRQKLINRKGLGAQKATEVDISAEIQTEDADTNLTRPAQKPDETNTEIASFIDQINAIEKRMQWFVIAQLGRVQVLVISN